MPIWTKFFQQLHPNPISIVSCIHSGIYSTDFYWKFKLYGKGPDGNIERLHGRLDGKVERSEISARITCLNQALKGNNDKNSATARICLSQIGIGSLSEARELNKMSQEAFKKEENDPLTSQLTRETKSVIATDKIAKQSPFLAPKKLKNAVKDEHKKLSKRTIKHQNLKQSKVESKEFLKTRHRVLRNKTISSSNFFIAKIQSAIKSIFRTIKSIFKFCRPCSIRKAKRL